MNSVRVLDVTLRDGGCVNNFNFGASYMEKILSALDASGVEYIELGYLDEKNGSLEGRTQYRNADVISDCLLRHKKPGVTYVAMMDYGKFDPARLPQRTERSIDGIRVAFHKKDIGKLVETGRTILEKGYMLFIQPMITLRYSEAELLELIGLVNHCLPDAAAFYIVDSFGEMRPDELNRLVKLVDKNLLSTITLGFHSHNNLQLSYSHACTLLQCPARRDLMLDCSIMGMGKGAGNLNTELLLEHLNLFYGKHYKVAPLLEVMDKVLNQLHDEFYWGYAPEYYLSATHHCSPTYASYFYNRHMLPIDQVGELLGSIREDKRISFDREYAEVLYRDYNAQKTVDDTQVVAELGRLLKGKEVLLIGPGKSLLRYRSSIDATREKEQPVTIGLNLTTDIPCDFILATRADVFEEAIGRKKKVITTSNVSKGTRGNAFILNYGEWIDAGEKTHDSSLVIAMNLLHACGVRRCLLAGLDGFSVNINDNYADPQMRRPVSEIQADRRNAYYKDFIGRFRQKGMSIVFITPSLYE